jgi:hypothetical protein
LIQPKEEEGKNQEKRVAKKGDNGHGITALSGKTATVNVQTPAQINYKSC